MAELTKNATEDCKRGTLTPNRFESVLNLFGNVRIDVSTPGMVTRREREASRVPQALLLYDAEEHLRGHLAVPVTGCLDDHVDVLVVNLLADVLRHTLGVVDEPRITGTRRTFGSR